MTVDRWTRVCWRYTGKGERVECAFGAIGRWIYTPFGVVVNIFSSGTSNSLSLKVRTFHAKEICRFARVTIVSLVFVLRDCEVVGSERSCYGYFVFCFPFKFVQGLADRPLQDSSP